MSVHMKLKNFKCELCEKAYAEKADLKKHEQKIHFCAICEQHYGDLQQHNEEKHGEKADSKKLEHFCTICEKYFENLKKHERVHFCTICGQHFENIKQHNEEEHVKLLHYCERCLKEFEGIDDLEIHMKIKHSIIFSFFCDYCEKGFTKKFQIEQHMDSHKRQFRRGTQFKRQEEIVWIQ